MLDDALRGNRGREAVKVVDMTGNNWWATNAAS
jgi:hypothetical protein